MHLNDVQADSFATAEAKGLHALLLPDVPVTAREHALILLARLHQRLDEITQLIKRSGLTPEVCECAQNVFGYLRDEIEWLDWLRCEIQEGELAGMTGCTHMSQSAASLIRLALMHTEISEASECITDVNADLAPETCATMTEEIADTVIRGADLVGMLGESLDTATALKLAYNKTRPYAYGTPHAAQEPA